MTLKAPSGPIGTYGSPSAGSWRAGPRRNDDLGALGLIVTIPSVRKGNVGLSLVGMARECRRASPLHFKCCQPQRVTGSTWGQQE